MTMRPGGADAGDAAFVKFGTQTNWPAGFGFLAAVAILLASAAVATAASAILTNLLAPVDVRTPESAPLPTWRGLVFLIAFQAAVIGQTLAASRFFGGQPTRTLSLRWPRNAIPAVAAAVTALGLFAAIYTAIVLVVDRAAVMRDLAPAAELARSDLWLVALVAIGVGAPVSEELLFRGFLLPALAKSSLRLSGAVVLTTLTWTALHAGYSIYGLVEVFVVGLFFSWLVVRTGSLWVPILCHAIYNSAIVLALCWLTIPL